MTPDEIKRSILYYAMQGKLVEQNNEEGTADELYDRISKIATTNKNVIPIIEDEIPFDIPESWRWCKFGEIVSFSLGKTPPRAEAAYWKDDIPWVSISDMSDYGHVKSTNENISKNALKKIFGRVSKIGTLLMSFKLTIGRTSILDIDAVHNEAIISIYPYIDSDNSFRDYLFYVLPIITQWGNSKKAIKGKTLNSKSIANLMIPLAPLSELKRIVVKMTVLFSCVDHYAKIYEELKCLNTKFPDDMEKSILQYAVQGKLVEQRPEEGTAEELYNQIQEEKQKLIKDGKIKKQKALAAINEDDIPFDIPESWRWVHFDELCAVLTCGYASTPTYVSEEEGMPFISAKNVKPYRFIPDDHKYIDKELYNQLTANFKPCKGDILLTRVGAGIGEAAIIDVDMEFAIYVSLTLIKLVDNNLINNRYILHWLNSPLGTSTAQKNIFGKGASQGNLNVKNVRDFLVPLPPFKEQVRIADKLDEVLPYCDRLVR